MILLWSRVKIITCYLILDKWTPISTDFGKTCPENVVSGDTGLTLDGATFGSYARSANESANKIISFVSTYWSWSVCQKLKTGIVWINIYLIV